MLAQGIGGYSYTGMPTEPPAIANLEPLRGSFWPRLKLIFADSFVSSAGQQYEQMCDLVAIAAQMQEEGVQPDWDVINGQEAVTAVRSWGLPPGHTKAPAHVAGQVAGLYEFWWLALRDAFNYRFHKKALPDGERLMDRMSTCGITLYATTSSDFKELAGIRQAFSELDEQAAQLPVDEFILRKCLRPHLAGAIYWQQHRRPRTDRGDVHELLWRTCMTRALAVPEAERTDYERLMVRMYRQLDQLLETGPTDPLRAHLLAVHAEAVQRYNKRHRDSPITFLHR